jgi:hypothetical protein
MYFLYSGWTLRWFIRLGGDTKVAHKGTSLVHLDIFLISVK